MPRTVDAERAADAAGAAYRGHARREGSSSPVVASTAQHPTAASGLTDQQLLAGLQAGSERSFSELYDRYFKRIYSFVYIRMRNHADAEEVVQETFMVVFRSIESYRGTASLLSWIYGIAKNTLNNNLRRQQAEGRRLDALCPDLVRSPSAISDCTPEEILCMRRFAEAVDDRLESIASWQSEIFAMRHFDDMSIQEISAKTHRSSDAVRSSLYRVKRLFFEVAELSARPLDTRPCSPRG